MDGAFEMVGACSVADVPAVASVWRSYGLFVGQNSTVSLCGEEVHAVVKYVAETNHLGYVSAGFERAEFRRPAI